MVSPESIAFPVANVLARSLALFSTTLLIPMGIAYYYEDNGLWAFIVAFILMIGISAVLWFYTYRHRRELRIRDGFILVASLWSVLAFVAALPFLLYDPSISFTHAYFEAMSGLSTTGATTLSHLDALPPSINFWRHQLNWIGGMGILVLVVAVLPMLGVGGMQLYKAEIPGPNKDTKLAPRITQSARNLWFIYTFLTICCLLALKLAGMSWFDAVCHAFSVISLGGTSTHDASVGYFNSPLIECVVIVFLLIGAVNFATHFNFFRTRSFKVYRQDTEAKTMLTLLLSSTLLLSAYVTLKQNDVSFFTNLRHVAFNLISIGTSSGFVSIDYGQWPIFAPLWMMLLSGITACAGSTGSGIKMIRTIILVRQSLREMRRLIHPQMVQPLKVSGIVIPDNLVSSVLSFVFLYIVAITLLSLLMILAGLDPVTSFTAIVACINNAGPGLNLVGPSSNYSALSDLQIWICSFTMLLGRLEIFSVLILFTPAFWRN